MRYAIVSDGIVKNVFNWDGENDAYDPGVAIPLGDEPCAAGWLYYDGDFIDPSAHPPKEESELYEDELNEINQIYQSETNNLSSEYVRTSLFDGVNEEAKKAAIYARLKSLMAKYASDINDLDIKYGG